MNNQTKTEITTIGELKPGDKILDHNGQPVEVSAVYDKYIPERMYEIEMEDGEVIQASGNHMWYCETPSDIAFKEEYIRLAKEFFENKKIPEKLEEDELFSKNDIIHIFGDEVSTMLFIEKACKSLGYSSYSPHLIYVDKLSQENMSEQEIIMNYSYNDLIDFLHKMKLAIYENKGYFFFGEVRVTDEIFELIKKGVDVNIPYKSELTDTK